MTKVKVGYCAIVWFNSEEEKLREDKFQGDLLVKINQDLDIGNYNTSEYKEYGISIALDEGNDYYTCNEENGITIINIYTKGQPLKIINI